MMTDLPSSGLTSGRAPTPYKVAIWFEGEQEFENLPLIFFVTGANQVQESFQFCFPDPLDEDGETELTFAEARRRLDRGETIYDEAYDVYVFLTKEYMEGNLFFLEYGPLVQITTFLWEENFSPPSVFEYLFHCILCASLYALCPKLEGHPDFTMGCQFEYTRIKDHDRVDIVLGYVCPEHRKQICEKLGEHTYNDIQGLFKFNWLGSLTIRAVTRIR